MNGEAGCFQAKAESEKETCREGSLLMHQATHKAKEKRQPRDPIHCFDCDQICCRTVVIEVDPPRSLRDYSDFVFYLHHKDTEVVVIEEGRKREWYVQYHSSCAHLSRGRCMIYDKRPLVCREYDPLHCERNTASQIHYLRSDEELFRYMKALGRTRVLKKLMDTHKTDEQTRRRPSRGKKTPKNKRI